MDLGNTKKTLLTINQMQADGVIGRYAIGGAVGLVFYEVEVDTTDDVDVYILLKPLPGQSLVSLDPIKYYLAAQGCSMNLKGYFVIADWQVQFLPADKPLLREALEESVEHQVEEVPVRVFSIEHLAAIAFDLGRPKDKARLPRLIAAPDFDESRFSKILQRHDLLERWATFKKYLLD